MAGMESLFSRSSLEARKQQALPERDDSLLGSTMRALGFRNDEYSKQRAMKRREIHKKYESEKRQLLQELRREESKLRKRLNQFAEEGEAHKDLRKFFREQKMLSMDKGNIERTTKKAIERFQLQKKQAIRNLQQQRNKEIQQMSRDLFQQSRRSSDTHTITPIDPPSTNMPPDFPGVGR